MTRNQKRILLAASTALVLLILVAAWAFTRHPDPNRPDQPGPLAIMAEPNLLPLLPPLAQTGGLQVPALAAASVMRQVEAGRADAPIDLYLVASEEGRNSLRKHGDWNESSTQPLFVDRLAVVTTAANRDLLVAQPAHLLQPIIKGIALFPAGDAYGDTARYLLSSWLLDKRLEPRLISCRDSAEALAKLARGEVSVAFIPYSERLRHTDLRDLPLLTGVSANRVPFFAMIPEDAPRPHLAARFTAQLRGKPAGALLSRGGFVSPSELPPPDPLGQRRGLPSAP